MEKKRIRSAIIEYLICILLTGAIIYAIGQIYVILLSSVDDVMMQNIFSGLYTGSPDAHSYFIKYPLALLFPFLYNLNGSIGWYKIFFLVCMAVCIFSIFCRVRYVQKTKRKAVYLVIASLLVLILFAQFIINLEWTITAVILGCTAIFRYITIPDLRHKYQKVFEFIICGLFFALSYCVRHNVGEICLILLIICVAYKVLCLRKKWRDNLKRILEHIVFLACIIASIFVINFVHNQAYSDKEWVVFSQFNGQRAALFDYYGYPDYDTYSEVYEAAGISKEAYELIASDYDYVVPGNTSDATDSDLDEMNLGSVVKQAKENYQEERTWLDPYIQLTDKISNSTFFFINIILIIAIVYAGALIRKSPKIDLAFFYGAVAWFIACMIYLAVRGRLVDRVIFCVELGFLFVLLGIIYQKKSGITLYYSEQKISFNSRALYISLCAGLAVMAFFNCEFLYVDNQEDAQKADALQQLYDYCNENEENVYFRDFYSFSQRGELFLAGRECDGASNYIPAGGWIYNSPIYQQTLERFDCTDIVEAIKENGNIYYLVNSTRKSGVKNRLNQYFESIDEPITVITEDSFDIVNDKVAVLHFCYDESLLESMDEN